MGHLTTGKAKLQGAKRHHFIKAGSAYSVPNIRCTRLASLRGDHSLFLRPWMVVIAGLGLSSLAGELGVRLLAGYRHNKVTMKLFEKSSLVADEGRKSARDRLKCVRSS
jgi:hypothetical protein